MSTVLESFAGGLMAVGVAVFVGWTLISLGNLRENSRHRVQDVERIENRVRRVEKRLGIKWDDPT